MIGVISGLILGLGYFFRDSILPRPTTSQTVVFESPRLVLPEKIGEAVFEDPAYQALKSEAGVPVKPMRSGVKDPFAEPEF